MIQDSPITGTPVRNLQEMLRALSRVHREIPFFFPDGVFGEQTLEGVMVFQRLMDLPVTGTVDQTTWDAIVTEFDRVERQSAQPRFANLFPQDTPTIQPGESSPLLYPIQGMFLALSAVFAPIQKVPPSGVLDAGTAANLRWLQGCGSCRESGALDRETWELLTRVYETFVSRQPQA